jgi:hypothetical protein
MISEYIATLLHLLMSYPFQPSTLKVKGRGFQGRGRGLVFHTLGLPLVYPINVMQQNRNERHTPGVTIAPSSVAATKANSQLVVLA